MNVQELINAVNNGAIDNSLHTLYSNDAGETARQKERYIQAILRFSQHFPVHGDLHLFSAPGRTEIGGNHTDHQHGCALGAAINLDAVAVVAFQESGRIRVYSENYGLTETDLSDLSVREDEKGTSAALVRGVAARYAAMGIQPGGFDAYVVSDVLGGSGLSSSAAFETLIASIIDVHNNNGKTGGIEIAKIGRFAENEYFGKACGLLDQTVCAVGGFVFLDFYDTDNPKVVRHSFDFEAAGYRLCIIDTKGSHSDLTDDYLAVPREMSAVAACFGKSFLRDVDEDAFFAAVPALRGKVSDRAVLRAMHFFGENTRAAQEAEALAHGDPQRFFALYRQSAASSANLLQNLYSPSAPYNQSIPLAIAVSKRVLGENADVRIHGGGFAGTIQAFVPTEQTDAYAACMDGLFGAGSCHFLRVRPVGGVRLI